MIARGVNRMPAVVALAATLAACGAPAGEEGAGKPTGPPETVDLEVVAELRDEGYNRSRVMEFAHVLTDLYGPRYANSPSYDGAAGWARDTLEEFGLQATLDPWASTATPGRTATLRFTSRRRSTSRSSATRSRAPGARTAR